MCCVNFYVVAVTMIFVITTSVLFITECMYIYGLFKGGILLVGCLAILGRVMELVNDQLKHNSSNCSVGS